MEIKKEDIIRLRKTSGQPIMDCKRALQETNSFDEAFEYIRKNATEKIDERRKDRVASEGRVVIRGSNEHPIYGSKIVMASLLCETDFTAKCDLFRESLDKIADILLMDFPTEESISIQMNVQRERLNEVDKIIDEVKAQTGEKVEIGQTYVIMVRENTSIGSYVHFDNKRAALVQFEANTNPAALQQLGRDVSMHIVASKPQFLDENDIDWSKVDLDIPEHLLSKPLSIIEKISKGKKDKFKKERVLLNQPYCLDDKITIDHAIKNVRRKEMMEITLKKFKHIEIGI